MIGFAFLSEVQHELDRRAMSRKDLAKAMGVSGSFLTQLFTGDKPLSDKHKAMFQRALGIRFSIKATRVSAPLPPQKSAATAGSRGPAYREPSGAPALVAEPTPKRGGRKGTG